MQKSCHQLRAILVAFVFFCPVFLSNSFADSEETFEVPLNKPIETKSYNKTPRFLAGEEVVTPNGKTLKVWSTEGPVSVSKSPEPFEDRREQQVPRNSNLLVDERIREGVRAGEANGQQ